MTHTPDRHVRPGPQAQVESHTLLPVAAAAAAAVH